MKLNHRYNYDNFSMNWPVFSYQLFLEKVIDDNQVNADAVLKANLLCITELR